MMGNTLGTSGTNKSNNSLTLLSKEKRLEALGAC
jgi:hypothetical protein